MKNIHLYSLLMGIGSMGILAGAMLLVQGHDITAAFAGFWAGASLIVAAHLQHHRTHS